MPPAQSTNASALALLAVKCVDPPRFNCHSRMFEDPAFVCLRLLQTLSRVLVAQPYLNAVRKWDWLPVSIVNAAVGAWDAKIRRKKLQAVLDSRAASTNLLSYVLNRPRPINCCAKCYVCSNHTPLELNSRWRKIKSAVQWLLINSAHSARCHTPTENKVAANWPSSRAQC